MTRILRYLRRLHRSEDGSATVEFAIFFPFFVALFISTFELGMAMTRNVLLDRAVDMTVRDIRLNAITPINHTTVVDAICDRSVALPNCHTELRLEMRVLDPRNWNMIPMGTDCVNRADRTIVPRQFNPGASNQLVILRACHLFDPFFPTSGLGSSLPRQSDGNYALASMSSFVVEPR